MDKTLTDSEIVKALECCANCESCDYETSDCPLGKEMECRSLLAESALDLINCLQARIGVYETCNARKDETIRHLEAENERLQNILICFMDALGKVRKVDDIDEISLIPLMSELNKQYRAELKAEAYKECIEKAKSEIDSQSHSRSLEASGERFRIHKILDNLLKELIGE